MDRSLRIRAADGGPAGPAHPSRPHPGDERGKLPAQGQQAAADPEATLLTTPVYGADLQGRISPRAQPGPPSGSQAYAPAAPANPLNQSLRHPGTGLLFLRSSGLVLLRP